MGLRIVRLQFQGPAVAGDGFVALARLVGEQAKQMDGIGLIRFQLQDSPIDLLGGLQPATLMMPDRNRQDFGDDCHARIVTI